ncbi:hypothetical protein [Streptomyces sp. NRRL F-2664]|uniref:hypothetical protein n=1 Tax=Streptomyces sp. NRRL F-2664 TaxID=1463842 RepID=UPI0004C80017|nr:hypothetical protein [Streptomyces sp. NRRL F-2664]
MGKIDHDAVLRARVLLLGSGQPSPLEEVHAYRVLAQVSPKAYLPKLVDALISMSHRGRGPEVNLALATEAVEAARRIGDGAPTAMRLERLSRALHAHERALFALGRREEGRAVCEELAAAGQSRRLAAVLAEEGRFREACELNEEAVRSGVPEHLRRDMVEWAANLEGAGLHDAAAAAFGELVDVTRRRAAAQEVSPVELAWELVHLSRMRESSGHGMDAAAVRQEALTVLEELAANGEPKDSGFSLARWVTLFALSGRGDEPAASPACPMPPFGTDLALPSATRDAFLATRPALEAEAVQLREAGRVPELVDVQRRISVRTAVGEGNRPHRFEERLGPYFDEGVGLARRLPGDEAGRLARALTDRAMFSVAARAFGPAHTDFAEASALLDAR